MPGPTTFSQDIFGFDPRSIAGCALWLDGADPDVLFSDSAGTTLATVGQTIGMWRDKSGNGRDYIQATAGSRPSYASLSNIAFTTTAHSLSNNNTVTTGGWDIFIVGQPLTTAQSSTWRTLFRGLTSDHPVLMQSGTTAFGYYNNSTGAFINSGIQITGNNRVIIYVSISPIRTYTAGINGIPLLSNYIPLTNGTADIRMFFTLGNANAVGTGAQQWGTVNEIIITSNVRTPQRQAIEGYLARKWNLQASLPQVHPYKRFHTPARLFTPASIGNCALWLDGADPTTLTFSSGSNVSTWRDKSPSQTTATANVAGAGRSIIYDGSSLTINNGSTNLNTNGVYAFLRLGSNIQTTADYTVSVVMLSSNYTSCNLGCLYQNFRSNWDSGQPDSRCPNFGFGSCFEFNDANNTTAFMDTNVFPSGVITLLTLRSSCSNFTLFYNGTNFSNVTRQTFSRYATDSGLAPTIGGGTNAANTVGVDNRWFTGRIYEVIVYNQALIESDRALVEGYLADKWGIGQLAATTFPTSPSLTPNDASVSSTLQIWNDATSYSTNGQTLNTWINKSSSGIVLTCTGNPTVVTNTLNGQPIISFATTSTWANTALSYNNYTIFFVGRQTGGTNRRILQTNTNNHLYGYWNGFKKQIYIDGNPYILSLNISLNSVPSDTNWDIIAFSRTAGGAWNMFWDGALLYASQSSAAAGLTGICINTGAVAGGESSTCQIAEIIIYNSVLTVNQIRGINVYLANKWGLTLQPLGNPFVYQLDPVFPTITNPQILYTGSPPQNFPTGLVFWMDATQETGANGSFVNTTSDRSGSNYTITATVNNTVTLEWNSINGMTAYNFGANRMQVASFVWRTRFTIAIVSQANAGNFLFSQVVSANNYNNYIFGGNNALMTVNNNSITFTDSVNPAGTTITGTGWNVWIMQYDNTNGSQAFRVNGTQRTANRTAGTYSIDTSITNTLYINGNGSGQFDTSKVGEICFFDDFLSRSACQQLEGYLAWKWGLKNSLPTTHPFYRIPPSISPNPIRGINFLYSTFYNLTSTPPSVLGPPFGAGWGGVVGTAGYYNPINYQAGDARTGQSTNLGIICKGFVYSSTQGTIRFRINVDDGGYVIFNNTGVITNAWITQPTTQYDSASLVLPAGYTPFEFRYFQGGGGMDCRLSYELNGSGTFLTNGSGVFLN